jgi:hypothetical protein
VVEGLQDPDATLPMGILRAHNIDGDNLSLRTTPFRSLETTIELNRFSAQLKPNSGVALSANNGMPTLAGKASIEWLLRNDSRIRQLAIDGRLDIGQLRASKSSVLEYLNKIIENQPEPSNLEDPANAKADLIAKISTEVVERSWQEVPLSLLSPNNILNRYQQILNQVSM